MQLNLRSTTLPEPQAALALVASGAAFIRPQNHVLLGSSGKSASHSVPHCLSNDSSFNHASNQRVVTSRMKEMDVEENNSTFTSKHPFPRYLSIAVLRFLALRSQADDVSMCPGSLSPTSALVDMESVETRQRLRLQRWTHRHRRCNPTYKFITGEGLLGTSVVELAVSPSHSYFTLSVNFWLVGRTSQDPYRVSPCKEGIELMTFCTCFFFFLQI